MAPATHLLLLSGDADMEDNIDRNRSSSNVFSSAVRVGRSNVFASAVRVGRISDRSPPPLECVRGTRCPKDAAIVNLTRSTDEAIVNSTKFS
jgi:hypothetical protein